MVYTPLFSPRNRILGCKAWLHNWSAQSYLSPLQVAMASECLEVKGLEQM